MTQHTTETNVDDELAYALITPFSLHKSRTGGIIARLLWANVSLVAARIYAPDPAGDFVERYCDAMYDPQARDIPLEIQRMLIRYCLENFSIPNERGISNRALLLLFRGPNAVREIAHAVGPVTQQARGDNARGTYGEYTYSKAPSWNEACVQKCRELMHSRYPALAKIEPPGRTEGFFEPAALTGSTLRLTIEHLKLFREKCYSDGGNVEKAIKAFINREVETSVVILKPESFQARDPMPGNLIDFFARTGMRITAVRVMRMDEERANRFYGAKLDQFRKQLKGMVSDRAKKLINRARQLAENYETITGREIPADSRAQIAFELVHKCEKLYGEGCKAGPSEVKEHVMEKLMQRLPSLFPDLEPDEERLAAVAEEFKDINAEAEFNELKKYMTSGNCMVLLYSGEGAHKKIRDRLKELRKVYGQNVLQNRAHASDPDENPIQERRTVGFPPEGEMEERPCDIEVEVTRFLKSRGLE